MGPVFTNSLGDGAGILSLSADGTLFACINNGLFALDGSSGTVLWNVSLIGFPSESAIGIDGTLFVATYPLTSSAGGVAYLYALTAPVGSGPMGPTIHMLYVAVGAGGILVLAFGCLVCVCWRRRDSRAKRAPAGYADMEEIKGISLPEAGSRLDF